MPAAQTPSLPRALRESTPPPPSAERCASPAPPSVARFAALGAVLVVDDDAHVRRIARRVLAHAGFEVIDASSGEEAVARLAEAVARVGVAVLDVTMPGMDGVACAAALRRLRPGLPVLYSSGFSADAALVAPGDRTTAYLPKPYRQRDLVDRVAALLAVDA